MYVWGPYPATTSTNLLFRGQQFLQIKKKDGRKFYIRWGIFFKLKPVDWGVCGPHILEILKKCGFFENKVDVWPRDKA